MTGLLIDLILVAVLAWSIWQGYRKGLFLTVAGLLIVFIAAFLAGRIAGAYAQPMSEKLYPMLSWVADDAIDEATKDKGRVNEMTDTGEISAVAKDTFEKLGIMGSEVEKMVDKVLIALSDAKTTVQQAIAMTVLYVLAYALLCIFGFILLMVGLTLLIHFLAAVFKLPGLKFIDKIGGGAAGALRGLLLLCAVGWAMRYLGVLAGTELVERTVVLEFFVKHNILAGLLSFRKEVPL